MFDTSMEVNAKRIRLISGGEAVSINEERLNGIAVLFRKTNLLDEGKDCFMGNGVECFFEVNQHNVVKLSIVHGRVELFVEEFYVAVH